MNSNDARVIQSSQSPRLTQKPLGKRQIASRFGADDLQRDQSVEFRLPCLIDCSHSAVAEKLENFKSRKQRREFLNRRRIELSRRSRCRKAATRVGLTIGPDLHGEGVILSETLPQQTLRAQLRRSIRRQFTTTVWAMVQIGHSKSSSKIMSTDDNFRKRAKRLQTNLRFFCECRYGRATADISERISSSTSFFDATVCPTSSFSCSRY